MQKLCANSWCQQSFEVTDDDLAFYDKISPVFPSTSLGAGSGQKKLIPPPTKCPECRMQRRLAYRNDRSLYRDVSHLSKKPIISMYNPDRGYAVYDQHEWWSDSWDPLSYGTTFDPTKSFMKQFAALQRRVPRFNVFNRDTENCEYVNYAPHCKNCYLVFGSWFNQDCFYGQTLTECHACLDSLFLEKSELCYECVDCSGNNRTFYCQNCHHCMESFFCFDCRGIKNCVGCWNLRNKEYHLFNQPSTKQEMDQVLATLRTFAGRQQFAKKFEALKRENALHQATTGMKNENSSGDFLFGCKNARRCFSAYRCHDTAYSARFMDQKDSWDFEGGGKGQIVYESMSNDFAFRSVGGMTCEHLSEAHYCDLCFECEHCFGCIGLRHKQHCILNKQYTKNEYEALVPKMIEKMEQDHEYGEFFPVDLSPFAYNETMAHEYFPLTKEEVLKRGWQWRDEVDAIPKVDKIIPAERLPDSIDDIPDDVLNWAIKCEVTGRPFKIVKQELAFYRKMKLPIPHFHPDERHRRRMALRNPRKLWQRMCGKCGKQMETTYAPERPEKVYCEECYLKEVY